MSKPLTLAELAAMPAELRRTAAGVEYTIAGNLEVSGFLDGWDLATDVMAFAHMAQDARVLEQSEP